MSQRTTIAAVQAVLGDNYGPFLNGQLPDLQQFIDTASPIVDQAVIFSRRKRPSWRCLNSTLAELVERWLAAHFYGVMDRMYAQRSTGEGASGGFDGKTGQGFESTIYGQQALRIDVSGCLDIIDKKKFASAFYGGRAVPTLDTLRFLPICGTSECDDEFTLPVY